MLRTSKSNNDKSKTAVTYIRTSTIEQNRISSARQLAHIKHTAKGHGVQIVADFADHCVPPSQKIRPGFEMMLDYLSKNKAAYVYMVKLNRLSRKKDEAALMVNAIEKTGAQLVLTEEDRAQLRAFDL